MPVTSVEALELSELLGALLGAVVDAQAASARATVDFIESVGFEVVGTERQMRTVRMRYTKKDENGEFAEFEVDVPLLALVNVPSLAVKQAVLTFGYDVVTATSGNDTSDHGATDDADATDRCVGTPHDRADQSRDPDRLRPSHDDRAGQPGCNDDHAALGQAHDGRRPGRDARAAGHPDRDRAAVRPGRARHHGATGARAAAVSRRNVVASLDAAEKALAHFSSSLERAGFGAGADPYRQMASVLIGQWVWVAETPERDLDARFARVADLAESIGGQLRPYVETMDRLTALRGLVAEKSGTTPPSMPSRILEALAAADRPMSVMELRGATRESTAQIRQALAGLVDAGQVVAAVGTRQRFSLPEPS
jgi:hypothetical protein